MIKNRRFLALTLFLLSGCNLYGGIDKPSGDAQLIAAARACLDSGDYVCARERYQAVSNSFSDIRISELAFTTMAENQVFSISDLISNLGSGRGDFSTFLRLAELIAARGKNTSSMTTLLQTTYATNSGIEKADLRAFMEFLTAFAMFNQILSSAVGADGVLTAGDFMTDPSGCEGGAYDCATDISGYCAKPAASALTDTTGDVTSMSSSSGWSTAPSFGKLQVAADAASTALNTLGSSSSFQGILNTMNQFDSVLGVAGAGCKRKAVKQILFP